MYATPRHLSRDPWRRPWPEAISRDGGRAVQRSVTGTLVAPVDVVVDVCNMWVKVNVPETTPPFNAPEKLNVSDWFTALNTRLPGLPVTGPAKLMPDVSPTLFPIPAQRRGREDRCGHRGTEDILRYASQPSSPYDRT